jgi:fructosamine-3-kinase
LQLSDANVEPAYGGDINSCYKINCQGNNYFLKINDAVKYPQLFEKEAEGLKALSQFSGLTVPSVVYYGSNGRDQYLQLSWIESAKPKEDFWERFGTGLARMHQKAQPFFGWKDDNYIGSLLQHNKPFDNWPEFFVSQRIHPLVKKLVDSRHFSFHDLRLAEKFCLTIKNFFPVETPSILHGDLWSGNFMTAHSGYAAIYDPAVYFGHREMDLGMARLFGGFDSRFFHAYNDIYPLEKDWTERLPVTQLYPILVHAILFGGHYITNAKNIIRRYAG